MALPKEGVMAERLARQERQEPDADENHGLTSALVTQPT
jgi:hypothetical protein